MALARTGAYRGGTRRVRGNARGRWADTFREHLAVARALVAAGAPEGVRALSALLDLVVRAEQRPLFPGSTPLARLRLNLPAEVATLWDARLRARGLRAAIGDMVSELVRWDGCAGGALTDVLAERLPTPESWVLAAEAYLSVLDRILVVRAARGTPPGASYHHVMANRALARDLARWNERLTARLRVVDPTLLERIGSRGARTSPLPLQKDEGSP